MTEAIETPVLETVPGFAPQRGKRKPAEPNPYDGVIAELAAGLDAGGYSDGRLAQTADVDAARKTRGQIRAAVKAADLPGTTSKVKFVNNPDGSVGVKFGLQPKKAPKAAEGAADEAQAAPDSALVGVVAPAPDQVDF